MKQVFGIIVIIAIISGIVGAGHGSKNNASDSSLSLACSQANLALTEYIANHTKQGAEYPYYKDQVSKHC